MSGAGQLGSFQKGLKCLGLGQNNGSCGQSSLNWNLAFDADGGGKGPVHVFLFLLLPTSETEGRTLTLRMQSRS